MYVLKNEDGTQSVSKELNDSCKTIGLWKVKYVNYKFIHSIVSELKFVGNPSFEEIVKRNQAYLFTVFLNNILHKRRIKIVKDELYISIIKHIESISNTKEYVTIASILKHFQQTDNAIKKQVLLDMVKLDLLTKSYHKVRITKNGFEYINK